MALLGGAAWRREGESESAGPGGEGGGRARGGGTIVYNA